MLIGLLKNQNYLRVHSFFISKCRVGLFAVVIAGYLVMCTSGCAMLTEIGQKGIIEPTVQVEGVNLKSINAKGATMLFDVKVDNPNAFGLKVKGLSYDIDVGGKPFTTGELESGAEVAANGSSVIQIPIAMKYTDVFYSITDLIQKKAAPYTIRGSANLGIISIPFKHSGQLEFKQ